MDSSDYIMPLINGLDISQNSPLDQRISIVVDCSASGTTLNCYFTNILNISSIATYISFDVVVYYNALMVNNLGYGFYYYGNA